MDDLLKDYYYNPKTGYVGLVKLYHRIKAQHPEVRLSDVRSFLDKQYTFQINRQEIRPKFYRTILAEKPRDNYQMDLLIYDRYEYDGYKYILCCVDVASRYASCRALKSRQVNSDNPDDHAQKLLGKIKEIFDEMGKPKNLNVDQEFSRALDLQAYFANSNIKLHVSETKEINKQAIVERFNRTLALLLQKWRTATGGNDWVSVLPDIVKNYNNSIHRTMNATPKQLWDGNAESQQTPIYVFETPLAVGDKVRVKLLKKVFDKGDALKYSPELYIIIEQKDATEAGRKLKKFKLRNVENGQILGDPRMWWKDYELKKQDAIVETIGKPKDYAEDAERVLTNALEQIQHEKEKSAKDKEAVANIQPVENVIKEAVREIHHKSTEKTKGAKDVGERTTALKLISEGQSYEDRKKVIDTGKQDPLRNLARSYGFKSNKGELPDDNLKNMYYLNPAGKWTDKPMPILRKDILRYEIMKGLVPPPSK